MGESLFGSEAFVGIDFEKIVNEVFGVGSDAFPVPRVVLVDPGHNHVQ